MSGVRSAVLIFLLALAVMVLEVALTRVFSFITYHHMTYLVIGVAMLGFGAAGTYLTLRPPDPGDSGVLARHATGFSAAALIALWLIPQIRFYPMDMYRLGDARNLLAMFPLLILAAAPFFFGGVGIAWLLSRAGASVNRIYFADLVGSACGAVLALGLVNWVGAVAACVIAAGLALFVAAIAAGSKRVLYALGGAALVGLSPYSEDRSVLPLYVPPGKQLYGNEDSIETVRWHVITRLDVGGPFACRCSFGGGLSRKYEGPEDIVRLVFQDGSNLTGIIQPSPTPEQTPSLGYFMQGAAMAVRPGAESLVIGSGGGVDVMVALHHGARHVVAVDVNPRMMDLVTGAYADFAGGIFLSDRVEPVVAEGRHFLSRDDRKFDVIQLSGVDTWAALSSGAYALTENFVYTAEAFEEYLKHLKPDGFLGFSRPFAQPPAETIRLCNTAATALERVGASQPERHVFLISGHGHSAEFPWAQLLVKRSPITADEADQLTRWASERGFSVSYDPFTPRPHPFDAFLRASTENRAEMIRNYPMAVAPVTDDSPFFFQFHRWRDLLGEPFGVPAPLAMWVLVASFLQTLVLSAVFILLPLWRRRRAEVGTRGGRAGYFGYFASLGLGFIVIEIALLQKLTVFVGGPAWALSITLFTLLLTSGLGSFLSRNAAAEPLTLLARVTPAIAVATIALAFAIDPILDASMGLSHLSRIAVAVSLLAPLGILLGMPFPAGLRQLDQQRPELKPWAWGINACLTVVGTTSCMLLVTGVGFQSALFFGAVVYLLGGLALRQAARAQPAAGSPVTP